MIHVDWISPQVASKLEGCSELPTKPAVYNKPAEQYLGSRHRAQFLEANDTHSLNVPIGVVRAPRCCSLVKPPKDLASTAHIRREL